MADQIKFCFVKPVIVDGVVVIAAAALATATVTETEKYQVRQPARITWDRAEAMAVDGTPVPLRILGDAAGETEFEESDGQMIATSGRFFPASPIALLYCVKRKWNTYIPPGKRYRALVHGDAMVLAAKPS